MESSLFAAPRLRPTDINLRPYQQKAVDAVRAEYQRGIRRTLVIHPTATGKTLTFGMIARMTARKGGRTLVVTHLDTLIDQAVETLTRLGLDPGIEVGKSYARALYEPDVVVASRQTLKSKRLRSWPRDYFRIIVFDEAHHSISTQYQDILRHFPSARLLGVTATADRADGESLDQVFESIADEFSLWDAMTAPPPGPYVCRVRIEQRDVGVDLRHIRTTGKGDFNKDELEAAIAPHVEKLARALKQEIGDRPTIVFTPDVGSAMGMASALDDIGVRARWVAGDSADKKEIINSYKRSEYQAICNCGVLLEGFDHPPTAAIGLLNPSNSRSLIAQQCGRGFRPSRNKKNCVFLDFDWLLSRHDLANPIHLFDTTHTDSEILEIADEIVRKHRERADRRVGDEPGIDLLDVIEQARAEKKRRTILRISARDGAVRYRRKVSYDPLGFDPVAAMEVLNIPVRKEADSLQGTITPEQKATLERFGLVHVEGCSKRRASTLIDVLKQRQRLNLARPKMVASMIGNDIAPEVALAMSFEEASQTLDRILGQRRR
jgi:superfamily II DNA or RNA helicase